MCVQCVFAWLCVRTHAYSAVKFQPMFVCIYISYASLHQKIHVCLQAGSVCSPLCVCCVCVILTWWPVRWRRAAFPAGHAGSPRSSSGADASRRRSCHSSGTCRRRGRLSASERRTAGPLLHILGSLSRSRWPGVSRGGMKRKWDGERRTNYLGNIMEMEREHGMRWSEKRGIRGEKRWNNKRGNWEGDCWRKIELDQERRADESGSEGEKKG